MTTPTDADEPNRSSAADRAEALPTDAPEVEVVDREPVDEPPAEAPPAGESSEPDDARRSRWLPALAVGLVLLVLVTSVAWFATARATDDAQAATRQRDEQLVADQASLGTTETDLVAARGQLTTVIDGLQKAQDQLDLKSIRRDQQAAAADQTRIQLYNLRASLTATQAKVFVQGNLLAALQTCLRAADQALNALAQGNAEVGNSILAGAQASCTSVNDYLQKQGLTT